MLDIYQTKNYIHVPKNKKRFIFKINEINNFLFDINNEKHFLR